MSINPISKIGSDSITCKKYDYVVLIPVCLTTLIGTHSYNYSFVVREAPFIDVTFYNKNGANDLGGLFLCSNQDSVQSGSPIYYEINKYDSVKTLNERFVIDTLVKHHDWNGDFNDKKLRHTFLPWYPMQEEIAYHLPIKYVTIRNELINNSLIHGGIISFRDPWYVDSSGAQTNSFVPYDLSAGPFHPTGAYGKDSGGVFLNQTVQSGVYYSVRALKTQTIGGYTSTFDHWETTNADLVDLGTSTSTYTERAVVFQSGTAVVKAMYNVQLADSVTGAWNMASAPLDPVNKLKTIVWPSAISSASTYNPVSGTNVVCDTINKGKGYWIKFPNNQSVTYTGGLLDSITIPVSAGWNMIGSISSPLAANQIKGDSIVESNYFKYTAGPGYQVDTLIEPGRGYWIKASTSGMLTLVADASSHTHSVTTTLDPPAAPGPPSAPVLLSPDSESTAQPISLTCSWNLVTNATTYHYELSTSSSFEPMIMNDSTLTTNSKTVSSLSYNTIYYWRIRAANSDGWGNWSSVWRFTTTAAPTSAPAAPVLLSPSNGATDQETSLYLTWNASTNATAYRAQVSTSSNFSSLFSDIQNITGTSVSITSLANSTTYYWRVNASNSAGTSAWSTTRHFTTQSASSDPCPTVSSYSMMDAVTISDATGSEQTLYLNNGDMALGNSIKSNGEMPPLTPPGVFHAKFKGDKFMHKIKTGKEKSVFPIEVKDAVYPLTIKWNLKDINASEYEITFKDGAGKTHVRMSGVGQTTINDPNNNNSNILITASAIDPCVIYSSKASGLKTEEIANAIPKEFVLRSNRPNPFNPTTVITYDLPDEYHVVLKVYDILGREVKTLVNETQSAGTKTVTFDGSMLASGVYYYRIEATSTLHPNEVHQEVMKMVLMK